MALCFCSSGACARGGFRPDYDLGMSYLHFFFLTNQNLTLKYLTFLKDNIYGPGGGGVKKGVKYAKKRQKRGFLPLRANCGNANTP